jgi:ProP effector
MPTLTASVAMRQALQKVAIRATRHAVHKSGVFGFAPSNEAAKSDAVESVDSEILAERRARTERINALVMKLRRLSPTLFAGSLPVPMALGIDTVIVAALNLDGGGQADLRFVLHRHVNGYLYQRALRDAAVRLDLDGQPAGEVTEEQRAMAAKRIAKVQARHIRERQARHGKRR